MVSEVLKFIMENPQYLTAQSVITLVLLALMLLAITNLLYNTFKISQKYKEKRKKAVRDSCKMVLNTIIPRLRLDYEKLIKEITEKYSSDINAKMNDLCGDSSKDLVMCSDGNMNRYRMEMELSNAKLEHNELVNIIKHNVENILFYRVYERVVHNTYHGLSEADFMEYCKVNGINLMLELRSDIYSMVSSSNMFINTEKYTEDDAVSHYYCLIKNVITIDNDEKKELKNLYRMIIGKID